MLPVYGTGAGTEVPRSRVEGRGAQGVGRLWVVEGAAINLVDGTGRAIERCNGGEDWSRLRRRSRARVVEICTMSGAAPCLKNVVVLDEGGACMEDRSCKDFRFSFICSGRKRRLNVLCVAFLL